MTRHLAVGLIGAVCLLAAPAAPAAALPAPVACRDCWLPTVRTSWQWQLSGTVSTAVRAHMYDIDMFEATPALVRHLHAQGREVVCYIDAGSWERWRPDAGRFPRSVIGRAMQGWPGERWLDIRRLGALGPLLEWRIERCAAKGFDGAEFDNVDGYQAPTGFHLTAADQLRFGKPVFEVEYGRLARSGSFCARANALGFESLRKHLALGPWRIPCR